MLNLTEPISAPVLNRWREKFYPLWDTQVPFRALNVTLLEKVMSTIASNPKIWDQRAWRDTSVDGQTTYCVGGLTVEIAGEEWLDDCLLIDSGEEYGTIDVDIRANTLLGLTYEESKFFFDGDNTWEDLRTMYYLLINERPNR